MAGALRHRGPEEFGVYRDARAGLAHARLSIIDLAGGGAAALQRGRHAVDRLQRRDLQLRRAARRAANRWAIASAPAATPRSSCTPRRPGARRPSTASTGSGRWRCGTPRAGELVLCRDRVGVRPLFLCEHDGRLWFASEVKALFAAEPSIPRALDPHGLAEVFTFWSCQAPRTPFAGVTQLEPGHLRIVRERADDRPRLVAPALPRGGGRPLRRHAGRRRGGAAWRARGGDAAAHGRARTCRSAATCPAGWTAR